MVDLIKVSKSGRAPRVILSFHYPIRVDYRVDLATLPDSVVRKRAWDGDNFDEELDEFDLPAPDPGLRFGALSWRFTPAASTNQPERYRIQMTIIQSGAAGQDTATIFSKFYEGEVNRLKSVLGYAEIQLVDEDN